MDIILYPGEWVTAQLSLLPGTPKQQLVAWAINAPVYVFAARSVFTIAGRMCGFYHPDHYRLWPRLPWRSLMSAYITAKQWYERVFLMGKRATGGFAGTLATLTLMYRPSKVFLGRAYAIGIGLLQPVGTQVSTHLFMYAMSGGGKTTALISIISTWRNSVFVIDPKAQITNALFRHDWRTWYVLDPYGISEAESACFNAMDVIKAAMERDGLQAAVRWAMRVAYALIITPSGSRTPFFTDTARAYVAGVILHVLSTHPEEEHNLPFVYDLVINGYRIFNDDGAEETKDDEAQKLLLRIMLKNPNYEGAVSGAAAAMASASGETGGNVRATLQQQLLWLGIPEVRAILRESSFSLSDLKTRKDLVLSLTAPVLSIREELTPFCRLLTNMTAYTFEAVKKKNGQCLTVIDELPSQGHNETLEVMLAVARSYGQTILGISQNISLMKKVYSQSWSIFTGESTCTYWLAINHDETAAHLSEILGKKSIIEKDKRTGRKAQRETDVLSADQVKRFLSPESGRLIVTRAGNRALKLMNEPYFNALPVWRYAADPDHREKFLRRIFRFFFDRKGRAHKRASINKPTKQPEAMPPPPHNDGENDFTPTPQSALPENIIIFPTQSGGDKS